MAGYKSDYWADAVLNYALRGTAIPVLPASLHLALFTAGPNSAGAGTEVSGGSYARVALSRTATGGGDANRALTSGAGIERGTTGGGRGPRR